MPRDDFDDNRHDNDGFYIYHYDIDRDGEIDTAELLLGISGDLHLVETEVYKWRRYCEDGSDYGVYPEDYETEDEYEEALREAKYGWREDCEDSSDYGIYPEDHETEDEYEEALREAKYGWREDCEDGSDYSIYPEDYETEDEYRDAIRRAKYSWRIDYEDDSDCSTDPADYETDEESPKAAAQAETRTYTPEKGSSFFSDFNREDPSEFEEPELYPLWKPILSEEEPEPIKKNTPMNKRRAAAAEHLSYEYLYDKEDPYYKEKFARCRFILDKADTVLAANYLSPDDGFLYAQAIKDHFTLPVSLPDEDENREYSFWEIFLKLVKRDIPLFFEVWTWTLDQFLPYTEYYRDAPEELINSVINQYHRYPEGFKTTLARYMDQHPAFMEKIIRSSDTHAFGFYRLIGAAVKDKLYHIAFPFFQRELEKLGDNWRDIIDFVRGTIVKCENYHDPESMEYFRDTLFPLVKAIDIGMVKDEIDDWEKEIEEHLEKHEERRRSRCEPSSSSDTPANAITPELRSEVLAALRKAEAERRVQEHEAKEQQALNDQTVYRICGVLFPNSTQTYHYRTEDDTIRVGDTVLVPSYDDTFSAKVVSVGEYLRVAAPYPIDKLKCIRSKIEAAPKDDR